MPSILFVCVANSFRSQMAEAAAKSLSGGRWDVWSAGSHPGGRVHPLAMELMRESGYDLSAHRSKGLHEVPAREWDYVVTMGCGDACPAVRARHRLDWDLPDPAALSPAEARAVRDRIIELVRSVVEPAPRS
jgi:arsenate reductase (thioredoxin)